MNRILVVDDDKQMLHMISKMLTMHGYVVSQAISGPLALASYATFHPDLVFLDVNMPGMSGIEVLHQLVEWEPGLPVVALSGDEQKAKEAVIEGARDYIVKPFELRQIEAVLKVHLPDNSDS